MDWLWPTLTNDGSIASRFGHILFWLGVVIAVPFVVGMLWTAFTGGEERNVGVLICAAFAAFFYMLGRGLCYVFSGD